MRFLTLALCACLLNGCAKPAVAPVPVAPCEAPQAIPSGGLTAKRAAILWNRDREALRTCGARLAAMIE